MAVAPHRCRDEDEADWSFDIHRTRGRAGQKNPKEIFSSYLTQAETAFIDNADDEVLLRNKQDEFARAIARGITDFEREADSL